MTSLCGNSGLLANWYVVALGSDIGEQPLGVQLLGEDYVIYRSSDGALVAALDRCPHRQAPLSAGTVKDGRLSCPYHGWTFGDSGHCVAVPSSPEPSKVPVRAHLQALPVQERYGLVWLCPAGGANTFPVIAEDADPAFRRLNTPVQQWKVSVGRMVDNFMDTAHFAFVHDASIGKGIDPVVEPFDVEQLDGSFTGYAYDSHIANPEEAHAMNGDTSPTTTVRMTTGFCLPFTVRGTMQFKSGIRQVLMICCTPVDELNSLFTFVIWRNDDADEAEILEFELMIDAEDQAMLEMLRGPLPLEPGILVSVRSDRASEVWRRELIKLMAEAVPN